ncbi:MAG: NAD(P)H-binding protein [Acidobacteriota bacterium]
MKLGITGASGQLGSGLVRHTLARTAASNVVGITRNTAKVEKGIEARAGDFSQPAGLVDAFRGLERLVIVPTSDLTPGVRTKQQADAIDAAVGAGVKHIIYISTVSPRPDPNNVLMDSHFTTEQHLIASGVAWTILRMSVYTDSLIMAAKQAATSGTYSAVPGAPASYVVRDDIAAAAAGILTSSGHAGITYHATGPVSLSPIEVAEVIGKATGKSISFTEMTPDQQRKGLEAAGLPPALVTGIVGFQTCVREGAFDLVTGDVGRLAGKAAVSPLEFLTDEVKA